MKTGLNRIYKNNLSFHIYSIRIISWLNIIIFNVTCASIHVDKFVNFFFQIGWKRKFSEIVLGVFLDGLETQSQKL